LADHTGEAIRSSSYLITGVGLGGVLGAAAGIVEILASRATTPLRIPFLLGADGLLGMGLGLLLAASFMNIRKRRGEAAALASLVGTLAALALAVILGIFANRILLRGAHILSPKSLALDVVAIAVAAAVGWLVARAIRPFFQHRGRPRFSRPVVVLGAGILFAAGAVAPWIAGESRGASSPVPSIILVSIDTLRPDHLSTGGDPRGTSPVLDRLMREGAHCFEATTPSPGSAPSHASLLTSRYPVSNGVFTNFTILDEQVNTWTETLRSRGYRTAGFVTNTFLGARFGFQQGFDLYVESGSVERAQVASPAVLTRSLAVVRIADRVRQHFVPGYDPSFETALVFLEEAREPLFLFVHIMDVHSPYAPPHPYGPRFGANPSGDMQNGVAAARRRNRFGWRPSEQAYAAEVRFADSKIGRLRRALEKRGLLDRAMLVLTSDHGENLTDHEPHFSHGRTLYDATLRVLVAFRGEGIARGALWRGRVENIDVAPTVARATSTPEEQDWEGRCLQDPAPAAPPDTSSALDLHIESPAVAQLQRDFALRTDREKIILREDGGVERFSLVDDPGETRSLPSSAERIEIARTFLAKWMKEHSTELYTRSPRAVRPEELSTEVLEKLRSLGYIE
jgi:arylsulfatase A-like enzyme